MTGGGALATFKPMARGATRLSRSEARRVSARLLRGMGAKPRGEFVAIEMRTVRPYVGRTPPEAVEAGLRKEPRGVFFIERLGYAVAGIMKRRRPGVARLAT